MAAGTAMLTDNTVSVVTRRGPRRLATAQGRSATIFLAPFFALFVLTMLAPIIYAVGLSLFAERRSGLGFGGAETVFTGLGNYIALFQSESFVAGFGRLAVYCLLYIPVMLAFAIVLALLLDAAVTRSKRVFQVLIFLPHAVPGVIATLIWAYLYTPGISPITEVLANFTGQVNLLGTDLILPAIANIAVWQWTGYNVIILFTALQAVDSQVLEAARVDGAGEIRTALSIKLPLVVPALSVILLFTVIGTLQLFSEPYVLGKVTTAISTTWVPNMWAYDAAFNRRNLPEAAAASIVIALAAAVLSFVVTRFTSRGSRS